MGALMVGLVSTLFMTGLVWFVQLVQYPLLEAVSGRSHTEYQRRHMVRTLALVTIPMLVEAAGAVGLVIVAPAPATWIGLALVAVIWASTLAFQAPQHFELLAAWSPPVHRALVRDNWIRTVAWSARSLILVWLLVHVLR